MVSLKAIPPTATDVTVAWSVCLYVVCHTRAPCVGQNEMPFGRNTHVVPSNIVLDWGPGPPREGKIWHLEPLVRIDVAYCQITLALIFKNYSYERKSL